MLRIAKGFVKRFKGFKGYNGNWVKTNNVVATELYNGANDVYDRIAKLPQPEDKVFVEYIWHGGKGELRGKTRVIECSPDEPLVMGEEGNIKNWSFDGSSTGQASGGNSDVGLVPKAIYPDPFRGGRHVICICECYDGSGKPMKSNKRHEAEIVFEKIKEKEMIFAFEQEYVLIQNNVPLGWPEDGSWPHDGQGQYYCGVGNENVLGRNFVEAHAKACLYAGLAYEGINAEVMMGQWEYQVGPCDGVTIGDQLELSRYFLYRLGEMMGISVNIHPKPIFDRAPYGGWNGSGNHCNCSSLEMRQPGGLKYILDAVAKLEAKHKNHMEVYGEHNELRLSGLYETQHIDKFSCGVADRGSSIRIQRGVFDKGYGWFEDRRPASNCDPWAVCSRIAKTLYDIVPLHVEMEIEGIEFDG